MMPHSFDSVPDVDQPLPNDATYSLQAFPSGGRDDSTATNYRALIRARTKDPATLEYIVWSRVCFKWRGDLGNYRYTCRENSLGLRNSVVNRTGRFDLLQNQFYPSQPIQVFFDLTEFQPVSHNTVKFG
jgi:hypothetical protein